MKYLLAFFLLLASQAHATVSSARTWFLQDVKFTDGSSATGSFTLNALGERDWDVQTERFEYERNPVPFNPDRLQQFTWGRYRTFDVMYASFELLVRVGFTHALFLAAEFPSGVTLEDDYQASIPIWVAGPFYSGETRSDDPAGPTTARYDIYTGCITQNLNSVCQARTLDDYNALIGAPAVPEGSLWLWLLAGLGVLWWWVRAQREGLHGNLEY